MFSKPLKFHKPSPYNNNDLTLLATIIIGSNRLDNCEHKIGLTIHYKEKIGVSLMIRYLQET